jgi:hypothetical protein
MKALPITSFGYLHSEVGFSLSSVIFPELQLVGIAFVVPMAANVMDQPVCVI